VREGARRAANIAATGSTTIRRPTSLPGARTWHGGARVERVMVARSGALGAGLTLAQEPAVGQPVLSIFHPRSCRNDGGATSSRQRPVGAA
jgi:hypothetical protein